MKPNVGAFGRRDPGAQVDAGQIRHLSVRVQGVVQGVGFRPFVYRLATEMGVAGSVRNDGDGASVELEGPDRALTSLLDRLRTEAPSLAVIERVRVTRAPLSGAHRFEILESDTGEARNARVGPDVAPCDACLRELLDPGDRRHRYPFINCTECGPRYTIVRKLPYDREHTTMAAFEMCEACRGEYEDPTDRRFHAQPNACAACGPRARLVGQGTAAGLAPWVAFSEAAGEPGTTDVGGPQRRRDGPDADRALPDAVAVAATALLAGAIVAVKGLGGYHLACRADDARVVERLRARKRREAKPFALMVPDVEAALGLVVAGSEELDLLVSAARPIVLARRRAGAAVAAAVAPRHRDLGVMLPSTPLHHLLMHDAGVPLVMTSGNVSGEPTLYRDHEAMERLGGVADLFLVHDRPIEAPADDSVVRIADVAGRRHRLTLRRARGYVPEPVALEVRGPDVLATGADLKSAACVTRGGRAWVAPCLGDLERWETLRTYREEVPRLVSHASARPKLVAHDLHPRYASTAYALEDRADLDPVGVQHHHAHLAACLVEHGHPGPALGAIFDGTGYGTDGTAWGGELLLGDLHGYERVGHLLPVPLPGGDAAVRQPWRMACAWLAEAGCPPGYVPAPLAAAVDGARWRAVRGLAERQERVPRTSSAGRLFDAVSAICGLCAVTSYEGQAAIELEAAAAVNRDVVRAYPLDVRAEHGACLILDPRRTIRRVARDTDRGVPVTRVAAAFHEGLARAVAHALERLCAWYAIDTVVLSGGVFQNVLLLELLGRLLARLGLEVLVPEAFPVNDGGVALGQAAVAAAAGRRLELSRAARERSMPRPGNARP